MNRLIEPIVKSIGAGLWFLAIGIQSALAKLPGPPGSPVPGGGGGPSRPWDWVDRIQEKFGGGSGMPEMTQGLEWLRAVNAIGIVAGVVFLAFAYRAWASRKSGGILKMLVGFSVFALATIILIGFI